MRSSVLVAAPARRAPTRTTATTSASSRAPTSAALLADLGLHVTTMGRGPDEDPLFFRATAAAGALAATPALGRVGRVSGQKLERLLNLTALLLDARRPLTAEQIQRQLDYPEDRTAFRRAFERDKDELRTMGIPLRVERVPGVLPEVDGYRIPREEYALRDPGLTTEELAALHLAASAVQVEGLPATEGLLKLGGLVTDGRP